MIIDVNLEHDWEEKENRKFLFNPRLLNLFKIENPYKKKEFKIHVLDAFMNNITKQ